ncbi:MAG: subclass B3 metallo-beta-lactamase [Acidobacteria bacterium]|nr:MAG: subclass B3 metallo-beta-lactamase [Acidobacteriota bacterium]
MEIRKLGLAQCAFAVMAILVSSLYAQGPSNASQRPGPKVSVAGHTYTQQELFQHNVGTPEDQNTQFPPHKIIGNVYYVGTASLASFLIVTPQGNILINSTYERDVPVIQKSVEQLGFKFSDIKVLLGSHAHADHMEGDALVKQLTGAQVMATAEDVPLLEQMKPAGKAHPIDKALHDGDQVTLGGTTLVAHLTPGHTPGCTTWTLKAQDGGKTYDVMIIGSLGVNPGMKLVNNVANPQIVEEFTRAFQVSRSLPCDVPLGSHPGMYNMKEKYAKLQAGASNPYIDPAGCKTELDIDEAMFHAVLEQQQAALSTASPVINPPAKATTSGATVSGGPASAPAAGGRQSALIAKGKERFQAYKCYDCHGENGEGTPDAPDLTHSKLTAEQVSKFLVKPSADAQNKGMPDVPADSPDHQPLVAYVMSLRGK